MNTRKLVRAYIVDDNREAIEVLRRMLESRYSVEVVGSATDAETAMAEVIDRDPDLLFVDVELPTMSGLEFCTRIRPDVRAETKVVFYTGHEKYMLEAIRRQAFDYLLKPPTEQDVSLIMTRYYENKLADIPHATAHSEGKLPIILVVNAKSEHLTLQLSDIVFFHYNPNRKVWEVVCTDGNTYMLRHRTTSDVILNYTPYFVQIHKRYIVNVNHIKMIRDANCILTPSIEHVQSLKISKNYRPALMDVFYSL